ncbi:hypothetical protein RHI45_002643 [Escherichia coli]|nr:hypothetical protein [Escherichia coli]
MKFIPADEAIDMMLSKMNHEEKLDYLKAAWDYDYKKMNGIHSKYGLSFPIHISELMSDDEAKELAGEMLKSPVTDDDIISSMLNEFVPERKSKVSLDDSVSILNELHRLDSNFNSFNAANHYLSVSLGDDAFTVLKAYLCADVAGCDNLKSDLIKLYTKIIVNSYHAKASSIVSKSKIISEDRSKAKKGKTNRHQSTALAIAGSTWEKYPNASLPGLSAEIYAHLRNKWNDVPVVGTIERWLKESGMNPKSPQKNRDFKLVIGDEE